RYRPIARPAASDRPSAPNRCGSTLGTEKPTIVQNIPDGTIDGSYYDERAVRTARHKLILRKFEKAPALRPGELYDLETDPEERSNLYASQVRLVGELGKRLEEWGRRTSDETAIELAGYAQR